MSGGNTEGETEKIAEAKKLYNYIKENVEAGKKLGVNTGELEKMLESVPSEIENGNFTKVASLCDATLAALKNAEASLAGESLFSAKMSVIEVKKTGSDITDLRALLRIAKSAIEEGDYSKAIEYSNRTKQEAHKEKSMYEETFEAMSAAAALIAEAKKFNVDATRAIERLLAARTAFERTDYLKAKEYALECRNEAMRIMGRFTSAKNVMAIEELIPTAEKLGINVDKVKMNVDHATELIKSGSYSEAHSLSARIRDELEGLLVSNVNSAIISTEVRFSQMKSQDAKISDYLVNAKKALEDKDYLNSMELVREAKDAFFEFSGRIEKVTFSLKAVEEKLVEAEKYNINVSSAKILYSQAEALAKLNDYSQASSICTKALDEIGKAESKYIKDTLFKIETVIEEAKVQGIDTSAYENLINQSKAALDCLNTSSALENAVKGNIEIEKVGSEVITAAIVKKVKSYIDAAKDALDAKNYKAVIDNFKKIKPLLYAQLDSELEGMVV